MELAPKAPAARKESLLELADDDFFEITVETSPPRPADPVRAAVPFIPLVVPLTTARLTLRPYIPDDIVRIHRIYGDPEVMRSVGSAVAHTVDELRVHLERRIGHQERHGFSAWAVFESGSDELVGDAGLVEVEGTHEIELSYRFRRDTWGRGYAAEVARAWVEVAFRTIGLDALMASVPKENRAAARVLEQLGMARSSETRSVVTYRILRDDFEG
ncbi:MAG: GNAT family N-acetyltransferase [Deltaproteobacteria bacterium]|nr:GNAT family N-acetyltransferase [Deltaproteobacteria bacterium]